MNLKLAIQFANNMGPRYLAYRVRHECERKLGVLRHKHPVDPRVQYFITLQDWRENTPRFLFANRWELSFKKQRTAELQERKERIINGEIPFFSNVWKELGPGFDWVSNPETGYRYSSRDHWSRVEFHSAGAGDIKFVWEKSRFTYLHNILRYDYHFNDDHSVWVFREIESWIDNNPVNCGPNYRCSQEMSIRLMNWCFALYFYKDSPALTEDLWKRIQHVIYWHLHHIYYHIDFSRIAVRNNHAITETLMLTLSNWLFPFIPETKKWAARGKKWFEEEVLYQVYEDGVFLQFSTNYQRVLVQLFSMAFSMARKNGERFATPVYERAYKALDFLYQCQQDQNGQLPNYGANDGALFYQFSSSEYRDYRPQLETLHKILTGKSLYSTPGDWQEESWWFGAGAEGMGFQPLEKKQGIVKFSIGGFYLIRDGDTLSFLRCGNHKDRPSQADNLHLDVWIGDQNVLHDSGSYKYNASPEDLRYFAGTASHNTVMLNGYDQMLKGFRFIWLYWTQAEHVVCEERQDYYLIRGQIRAFTYIGKDIHHQRNLKKFKGRNEWVVNDKILNKPEGLSLNQIWNMPEDVDDNNINVLKDAKRQIGEGRYSSLYGTYTNDKVVTFSTEDAEITTSIKF